VKEASFKVGDKVSLEDERVRPGCFDSTSLLWTLLLEIQWKVKGWVNWQMYTVDGHWSLWLVVTDW